MRIDLTTNIAQVRAELAGNRPPRVASEKKHPPRGGVFYGRA